VCYKSEDRITSDSAEAFIDKIMKSGHLSVIEHAHASIRFVTDRGVTHEMVRHRLASYCQESTRYCNYSKSKFGGEITVIEPQFKNEKSKAIWEAVVAVAEASYETLTKEFGESPGAARSVLPQSLSAEIVMTCNFREWLHVFALRTASGAHPDIRKVMGIAQAKLADVYPVIFARD
jgi:thymidylate synthase (FAD)